MVSLVSTEWLAAATDVRIVDASWQMIGEKRDTAAEFIEGHIPGAVFLNLGSLADPESDLDMMLPSEAHFSATLGALGVSNTDRIVLYDNSPTQSATRAWWMLKRVFGADNVAILDGGYGKWCAEGRPIESGPASPAPASFTVRLDASQARDKAQIIANLDSGAEQLLDARGAPRFTGAEGDPRPHVAAGHIPGSLNLHYARLFEADGCWKRGEALKSAFVEAGVNLTRPIVTTCGSGMTAAILTFGLHLLGKDDVALYDGSWSDWGADPATPKALGPA